MALPLSRRCFAFGPSVRSLRPHSGRASVRRSIPPEPSIATKVRLPCRARAIVPSWGSAMHAAHQHRRPTPRQPPPRSHPRPTSSHTRLAPPPCWVSGHRHEHGRRRAREHDDRVVATGAAWRRLRPPGSARAGGQWAPRWCPRRARRRRRRGGGARRQGLRVWRGTTRPNDDRLDDHPPPPRNSRALVSIFCVPPGLRPAVVPDFCYDLVARAGRIAASCIRSPLGSARLGRATLGDSAQRLDRLPPLQDVFIPKHISHGLGREPAHAALTRVRRLPARPRRRADE